MLGISWLNNNYYYYRMKRFRWRNVKRLQRHLTNAKNSDKTRVRRKVRTEYLSDAMKWNEMKWKCGDLKCVQKPTRGRLSRDQENFEWTVPSSTDVWRTPVEITMWEISTGCSMSAPQPRSLAVTLTFNLLTSKSNQFTSVPNSPKWQIW